MGIYAGGCVCPAERTEFKRRIVAIPVAGVHGFAAAPRVVVIHSSLIALVHPPACCLDFRPPSTQDDFPQICLLCIAAENAACR